MRVDFEAPQHVRDTIASLGRTEDVKFSPSNQRIALVGYRVNKVAVVDVSIDRTSAGAKITLTDSAEIFSSRLRNPHGLDFIDDETLIVCSRKGDVPIFRLPPAPLGGRRHELEPLGVIGSGNGLRAPGSVSVSRKDENIYEALICNNRGHTVTKHQLDLSQGCSINGDTVLLKKWLDIPDGVCVSPDRQWIAVSNHKAHSVFLYENNETLNEASDPDCILRCVHYPHGLEFTADGRYLLAADAGSPFVHVYRREGPCWRGLHNPLTSFRVVDDDTFLRGRHNPMEGGPKGIAISNAEKNIFVTTNECQNLAFFDLAKILDDAERSGSSNYDDIDAYQLAYELDVQREVQNKVNLAKARGEQQLATLINSNSWKITVPLRWVEFCGKEASARISMNGIPAQTTISARVISL